MFWTNKVISTQRLVNGAYEDNLSDIRARYEPTLPSGSAKEYVVWASHIEKLLYCVPRDIQTSDRILVDGVTYVVIRQSPYRDTLWKHDEILMRQVWPSHVHQQVTLLKASPVQNNFDPLFQEYTNNEKTFDSSTLHVILDPIQSSRNYYIEVMGEWKLEGIEYVATIDLPLSIQKEDKFVLPNWDRYEIQRIEPRPYEYIAWISKTKVENFTS